MRIELLLAFLLVGVLSKGVHADASGSGAVPLFLSLVEYEPSPPIVGAHQVWRVELNHAAIRQPAGSIRVNIPGMPEGIRTLVRWQPRAGFIDGYNPDHPLGLHQIPDPNASEAEFSWRWYGSGVSLTVHKGHAAGNVTFGARWFWISPRGEGLQLLIEPSGSAGPPLPLEVPVLQPSGVLALVFGLIGFAYITVRRRGRRPFKVTPASRSSIGAATGH